jgi:inhibitor of KinA sporulation pathway (predicted exonuclease)
MSGLSGSPDTLGMENQVEFHGDEHNALDDTLHQIKMLFAAKQRYQSVEIIHAAR